MRKLRVILALIMFINFYQKVCAQNDYLGDIKLTAINFNQEDWLPCDGRELSIGEYSNLYSLVGTTYGGNGSTTFALPDLRGRVPIGQGVGAGLTRRNQGSMSGTETNTLTESQMPSHSHTVNAISGDGNESVPTGNFLAGSRVLDKGYSNVSTSNTTMNAAMVGSTGQSQVVNNMQPYTVLRYVICVEGAYPSR